MEGDQRPSDQEGLAERLDLSFALLAAGLGVWELDPITKRVNCDDQCRKLVGIEKDSPFPYGQTLHYIHPEDVDRVNQALQWAMNPESNGMYDATYRTIGDDGQQRWIRSIGRSYFDETGQATRFSGVVQAVSQEMTGRHRQEQFTLLVEQAPELMAVADLDGRLQFINGYGLSLLGLTPDQVTTMFLTDFIPSEEMGRVNTEILPCIRQGKWSGTGIVIQPGTRQRIPVFCDAYLLVDTINRTPYGIAGIMRDQRPELAAQQEQLRNEAKFRSLIEEAPISTCLFVGEEMRIDLVNEVMLGYWGRDKSVIGKPLAEALPELKGQPHFQILEDAFKSGETREARQVRADIQVNGEPKTYYFDLVHKPLRNAAGEVYGIMDMSVDVTQQVIAQQQLKASEARLRSIIATAPAGMGLFVGRDLIVELPNQTFIDIVGKGPDIVGKPLREVMPELLTENQPFLQILDDVYTSGTMFQSYGSQVSIVQHGVMTHNYYNITYTPLRDEAGEVYAILDIAIDVTAQVKAQQALAESEAHLELLRDTVPAMIFYLDSEQRYQSYNGVFRDWFGVDGNEAIGKTVREFIGEEAYANAQPHLAIAYGGQQERYEIHTPSRMATDRWLSIVYTPYKVDEGDVIGVIVHATDITQRKQAEIELRHSEAQFRSLVEEAPIATMLLTSPNHVITLANQSMISMLGKGTDILGHPAAKAVPEIASQTYINLLDNVFTSGKTYQAAGMPSQLVNDGVKTTHYFDFTYKPMHNEHGETYGILCMAVDVTEAVLARQKLQEAEEYLRGAMELADIGTWELDMSTGLITYSKRLRDLFEFSENSIDVEHIYNPIHEPDRPQIERAFARASTPESGGLLDEEYSVVTQQTGRLRIVRVQARMYFDARDKPLKMVGTMRDITEQKQIQLALEQEVQQRTEELAAINEELTTSNEELAASNEKSLATNEELNETNYFLSRSNDNLEKFAYVASHDLQEPLRKVQSFGDLLKERYGDQLGEGIDYLDRMQSAASRMSTLIRDLLTYSRISTRRERVDPVPLNEVMNRVLTSLELPIQETGAVIRIDPLPTVQGDASQLEQLFQNLLSNSIKFRRSEVTPMIALRAGQVHNKDLPASVNPARTVMIYHKIDIIDNGVGFDEKYLDRIFEVFQRLHSKREFEGTGIGLAICEKVVANHGGAITASSSPGQGAAFSIYLPA